MSEIQKNDQSWPPESPELAAFRGPHVAVDVALFTVMKDEEARMYRLGVLLHKRTEGLETGKWALPGRMVRERERLNDAVTQALKIKCDIEGIQPKQLFVFDEPSRDERGWVMSVGYATTQIRSVVMQALDRNPNLALGYVEPNKKFKLSLPEDQKYLPFEQNAIVEMGVDELRNRYLQYPDPDQLLGSTFTLYRLRKYHEAILGYGLDKDLFRRKMEDKLIKTDQMSSGSIGKPAQLFKRKKMS